VRVDEHTIELAGSPVFFRTAPASGTPSLYLHGIPTSSDDWIGMLGRTGGIAPDLIGFGRSGKGGHLEYTLAGLAEHLEQLLDQLGLPTVRLVAHDWGAPVGLTLALRRPSRIERIVLVNPLPLGQGADKSPAARLWRTRGAGELAMGATTRWLLRRALKQASTNPDLAWPSQRVDQVWEHFDQGTQRAILRLHRAADESTLIDLGNRLAGLSQAALILWGDQDPWYPSTTPEAYAAALSSESASVEHLPTAGHWPWLDDPQALDRLAKAIQ
jgi:pimeloyl-ACP methyl ester carboxylesterase